MEISRKTILVLSAIFIIVLASRLYFAFQTPNFALDSYFSLRQADHIAKTGFPLYNDPLSFGGRTYIFPPLFQYLLAFFSLILGSFIAGKILPNVLYAAIPIIVFFLSMKLTQSKKFSAISAVLSGFIPVIMKTSLKLSSQSLFLPLFFLIIYLTESISEKKENVLLILMVFLVLTTSATLLFVFIIIIYLILLKLEGMQPSKKETELSVFFIFLAFWSTMMIYKKALFFHGLNIFSQNIPQAMKSTIFSEITFGEAIIYVGLLVLGLGIYGAYIAITSKKSKGSFLLVSSLTVFFLALLFKAIPLEMGLEFMGVTLAILSSTALAELYAKVKDLKFFLSKYIFFIVLGLLFIIFSIIPSAVIASDLSKVPTTQEIDALKWIRENTPNTSTVLATPQEGHLISFVAERKNFFDTNFLNIHLIDQRYNDLRTIYTSRFQTDAIPLLRYYKIDYIYFSDRAKQAFNATEIPYVDKNCFETLDISNTTIYGFGCIQ